MTRNTRRGTPVEIEGMWPRDERMCVVGWGWNFTLTIVNIILWLKDIFEPEISSPTANHFMMCMKRGKSCCLKIKTSNKRTKGTSSNAYISTTNIHNCIQINK